MARRCPNNTVLGGGLDNGLLPQYQLLLLALTPQNEVKTGDDQHSSDDTDDAIKKKKKISDFKKYI